MLRNSGDMTSVVDLTREKGTGSTRRQRPIYVDLLPPCNNACPAGENIQEWLALAQASRFRAAWEVLVRDNPLPAVHGRVCYHPCETSCNRKEVDSAVSIHAVERFLGDLAAVQGWQLPIDTSPSGKRVLVVGAGPSGLSAAYHLTRLGHAVEIHEAGPLPGGMLHFGIPAYRLPRKDLMKEVERIKGMGVKIVLNHKVEVGRHCNRRTDPRPLGDCSQPGGGPKSASQGSHPTGLCRRRKRHSGGGPLLSVWLPASSGGCFGGEGAWDNHQDRHACGRDIVAA